MKKIYPNEWLGFHPYKNADEIDSYYADLASRILKEIYDKKSVQALDEQVLRDIAIRLTVWFEDVISGVGLWAAFTGECMRRYGKRLPFYVIDESDYFEDEVNLPDVRFLVWHFLVETMDDGTFLDPEDEALMALADDIYAIFDAEFESAPINERLYHLFHDISFTEPLLYDFRDYVMRLAIYNYLDLYTYDYISEARRDEMSLLLSTEAQRVKAYDDITDILFNGRMKLIGLTTAQWGALLIEQTDKALSRKLFCMETTKREYWFISGQDDTYFYLKNAARMERCPDEVYNMRKDSMGQYQPERYVTGEICICCRLTKVDGEWMQNGAAGIHNYEELRKEAKTNPYMLTDVEKGDRLSHELFIKATGGEDFIFISKKDELADFGRRMYGEKQLFTEEQLALIDGPTMLRTSPTGGMDFIRDNVDCIKSERNPFYNKDTACRNALRLIADRELTDYDTVCFLWNNGMLEDAAIDTHRGYEYGRRLLRDNAQFVIDYCKCDYRQPLAE